MADDTQTTKRLRGLFQTISGVLDRGRLFDILSIAQPRICVVSAPSGFGKTTLLRSWLLANPQSDPVVWVAVNYRVSTRDVFWEIVADTAARAGLLSDKAHSVLIETLRSRLDPVAAVVATFGVNQRLILVLDAYEHLGELCATIDDDLIRLTSALLHVRVVVTTRSQTSLAGPELALQGRVHTIGADQLSFTAAEVAELVAEHVPHESTEFAGAVHSETKGYPLATRALLLAESSLRSEARPVTAVAPWSAEPADASTAESDDAEHRFTNANTGFAPMSSGWRTLVARQLRSQLADGTTERFVADTCVPPYFDIVLATALSAPRATNDPTGDVRETLNTLERHGFGRWIPFARDRPVFQYVEVIRDLFLADLRSSDHGSFVRLASKSARWLFANGDHELALKLAVEATDYALAAEITQRLIIDSPESYTTDRLGRYLNAVPRTVMSAYPVLAFALGLSFLTTPLTRGAAVELFHIAARRATADLAGVAGPEVFFRHGMKSVSLRLCGYFTDSATAAQTAIRYLDQLPASQTQSLGDFLPMALRHLAYSLFQAGQLEQSSAVVERAVAVVTSQVTQNYTLAYAAGIHGVTGDGPRAVLAQAAIRRSSWPRNHEHSYMNALGLVGSGSVLLDRFEFSAVVDLFADTESYIRTAEFWPVITAVIMHARLGLGEAAVELHRVTSLMAASPAPPGTGQNLGTALVHNGLALLNLAAGRYGMAASILEPYAGTDPQLAPARLLSLLLADRSDSILRLLTPLLQSKSHTHRSRAATLTLGAAAALTQNNRELSLSLLEQAAALWRNFGVRSHLLYLPEAELDGLKALGAETGVGADYLLVPTT
jgi:LuxR family maltose regulon positive regulatory protein